MLQISGDSQFANPGGIIFEGGELLTNSSNDIPFSTSRAITLDSQGGTIAATTDTTATYSSIISDGGGTSGTLTIGDSTNKGTVIFTGSNTYAGPTLIVGGTLAIGAGGSIASSSGVNVGSGTTFDISEGGDQTIQDLTGSGTVALGGNELTVGTTNSTTFSGVIKDGGLDDQTGGSLIKQGNGTLTLTGENTYTGDTTITAGTLAIGAGGSIADSSVVDVGSGSTFDISQGGHQTIEGLTGSGTVAVGSNELTVDTTDTATFSGVIQDGGLDDGTNGSLNKAGSGTLILTGNNTYTGGTTITEGALVIGDGGTTGSIVGNVNDEDSLVFDRSDNIAFGGVVSGEGDLTQGGSGTLTLTGANTYTGETIINAGTLAIGAGVNIADSSGIDVKSGGTFDISQNGDQTIQDLTGSGTVALGNNELTVDTTNTATFSGVIEAGGLDDGANGSLNKAGSGTLILTGTNTYTEGTTITAGTLQIGDGGTSGSIVGNVNGNGSLVFDRSDDITFAGDISSNVSVTQDGPGMLTLTGDNTYAGGTTINDGVLQVASNNNLGSGNITLSGGELVTSTNGFSTTKGVILVADADVNPDPNTLAAATNTKATYIGIISGTGALTVGDDTNTGTVILFGNNTYSGGTTVDGGVLQVASNLNLGTGAITLNGGELLTSTNGFSTTKGITLDPDTDTLATAASTTATYNGVIGGTGALIVGDSTNTGTLVLTAANTYTGGTTIASGTLQVGNGASGGSIVGNVVNNGSLVFDHSDAITFGGDISGSGGVTQSGGGILTLTGTNTYQGDTTIQNAGVLVASDSNLGTGNIILGGGELLTSANGFSTSKGITLNAVTNTLAAGTNTTATYNGVISGDSLNIGYGNYNGAVILTAANTYSGGTTVGAGILVAGSSTTTSNGVLTTGPFGTGLLTLGTGATLADNGSPITLANSLSLSGNITLASTGTGSLTFDGTSLTTSATVTLTSNTTLTVDNSTTIADNISGDFSLTKLGTGTLTLTGVNSSTGATTVTSGILVVSNTDNLSSGTITLSSNSTLQYTGGAATLSQNITVSSGSGTIDNTGGGELTLAGTLSKPDSDLVLNGGAGGIDVTGQITSTGAVGSFDSDLYVTNGTTTVDSANNNYTGTTHVYGNGTLVNGLNDALPGSTVVALGDATLENTSFINTYNLNGYNQTVAGLTSTNGSSGTDVNSVVGGTGNGATTLSTLTIAPSGTDVFSGILGGSGSNQNNLAVVMSGTGSLALTGNDTYTGGTTITAGTLKVGSATALGTGSVTNNGTLEAFGSEHVINIGTGAFTANYTQGANGILSLNINSNPGSDPGVNDTNDVLKVTGTASLNGTLSLNFTPSLNFVPTKGQTFEVVETNLNNPVNTDGITTLGPGFSAPTVTPAGAGLSVITSESIDDNNLFVTINSTQLELTSVLGSYYTPNRASTATYIDAHIDSGPLYVALVGVVTDPQTLAGALDQLTPLNFANFASSTAFNNASFSTAALDGYLANHRGGDGSFVSSAGGIDYSGLSVNDPNVDPGLQDVHSRLLAWSPPPSTGLLSDAPVMDLSGVDMKSCRSCCEACAPVNPWNVFISGNVVLAQDFSDPTAGLAHADATTGSVSAGADYKITPHFLVGAEFAYGHTHATLDDLGSSASVDTYSPGVYASYSEGGWYANALGSYGFANYNQNRNVAIGAFTGTATSHPGGDQIVGDLDGGYDFHRGPWTFGPTLGAQYAHLDVDGFTESGLPGADLTVNQDEADSLRSSLGGRISYAIKDGGVLFNPHLSASWQHEFLDQSRGITSQFNGLGAGSFVVQTPNPSRDSALVDVGLDAQVNNALTVFTDYTVQAGQSNYFGQSVEAGFKIGF